MTSTRTQISIRLQRQAISDAKGIRQGLRLVTPDAERVVALVKAARMPVLVTLRNHQWTVTQTPAGFVGGRPFTVSGRDVTAFEGRLCVAYCSASDTFTGCL